MSYPSHTTGLTAEAVNRSNSHTAWSPSVICVFVYNRWSLIDIDELQPRVRSKRVSADPYSMGNFGVACNNMYEE